MTTTTTTAANPATVTVRRSIAAPAEVLFDAWLDPESAAVFMNPEGGRPSDVSIDARPGGAFSILMHGATKSYPHHGIYKVIERPRQLVFTWISEATHQGESLVTVEFKVGKGSTEVVITHERLPEAMAEAHVKGWTEILSLLAKRAG
jgi:uncharacterized protein YndB with AHSA1/START domain